MNWLKWHRVFRGWMCSKHTCLALKSNSESCAQKAVRGSRYCWKHQSKLPWIIAAIGPLLATGANWVWSQYHPSEELRHLRDLVGGRLAELGVTESFALLKDGAPVVATRVKNFGNVTAKELNLTVTVAALDGSRIFAAYAESLERMASGADEGLWVKIPEIRPSPNWPELILVLEATFRTDGKEITQSFLWLGILESTPVQSLTAIPAGFSPADRERGEVLRRRLKGTVVR